MNDLFRNAVVSPIDPQLHEFVRDLTSLGSGHATISNAREQADTFACSGDAVSL